MVRSKTARWRLIAAIIINLIFTFVVATPALADCVDPYNGLTYCPDKSGCGHPNTRNIFFTQVSTQAAPCYWKTTSNGRNCPPLDYTTQGVKGNISRAGNPALYVSTSHATEWIEAQEDDSSCNHDGQAILAGCWVQLGWILGEAQTTSGCNPPQSIQYTGVAEIHTEIYDDTSAPCFMSVFGQAPYNASYDVHFVSTLGNGLHHYGAYFQAPSGSTQYLAYGDMHAALSAQFASGEVSSMEPNSGPLYCTRLGATSGGENIFGYAQADLGRHHARAQEWLLG